MTEAFADTEALLAKTMLVDRHRLRQQWRAVRDAQRRGSTSEPSSNPNQKRSLDERTSKFQADLARSCQRSEQRRLGIPKLIFDDSLPVVLRKDRDCRQ